MTGWWVRFALGSLLLVAPGCGDAKSLLGLYPTRITATESVDQRHYVGSSLPEIHDAARVVLRSLSFRILEDRKHTDQYEPVRVLEAERSAGETVRLVLAPQGGGQVLVSVQVKPPESTLAAEIQTELAAHLLRAAPP